ncbi:DUF4062 domain-containing protein [Paenibacillus amylolyticus]|uniref:DUF4062 domain-containing protein n=1 Tax=Paenibacillus amylolyticus TaxID=1451 RepID=A0ABD8B258_PAEAM
MAKKLQVFVSSTFTDLEEERQAAVEAILKASHIPAGMELFRSGDQSQKDTIRKWIEESDVYLLILGGRYGAIEETSGNSYTHWEYDLAGELGKPRFSVVMSEGLLNSKVKTVGTSVMELDNVGKYRDFKKQVLSKISRFFDDTKDIQLTIMQTLSELSNDPSLEGWVSGKNATNSQYMEISILELTKELKKAKLENERLRRLTIELQKKEKELHTPADISDRLENILGLLEAKYIGRSEGLGWETVDEKGNIEEVLLEYPSDFDPYYILKEDNETYNKFLLLNEIELGELNSVLAKIRILIRKYKHADGVPFHFVLAIAGEHPELEKLCDTFIDNALKIEQISDKGMFRIEIWDENVISTFEEKLGLSLAVSSKN